MAELLSFSASVAGLTVLPSHADKHLLHDLPNTEDTPRGVTSLGEDVQSWVTADKNGKDRNEDVKPIIVQSCGFLVPPTNHNHGLIRYMGSRHDYWYGHQ